MKISVNLATRPYVDLRPFFLRMRVIMGALAVVAIGLVIGLQVMRGKLEKADAQMQALRAQTMKFQNEKRGNEARMRQPANAAVLDRARFLNALFLKKSFSWTAVMMDLETVLPSGVQVTSIEPQTNTDNDVIIHMRVAGERDRAILLVRNLELSKRFLQPRLSGESQQAKETAQQNLVQGGGPPPGVQFEIFAKYNPLPEGQPYPKMKVEDAPKAATNPILPVARPVQNGKYPKYGVVLPPKPQGGVR